MAGVQRYRGDRNNALSGTKKHSNVPRDRVLIYIYILVDYREQKKDKNGFRITAVGQLNTVPR